MFTAIPARLFTSIALVSLALAAPAGAFAQAPAPESTPQTTQPAPAPADPAAAPQPGQQPKIQGNTEEVVVTARRVEEQAQDVPIPLSIVGGAGSGVIIYAWFSELSNCPAAIAKIQKERVARSC